MRPTKELLVECQDYLDTLDAESLRTLVCRLLDEIEKAQVKETD